MYSYWILPGLLLLLVFSKEAAPEWTPTPLPPPPVTNIAPVITNITPVPPVPGVFPQRICPVHAKLCPDGSHVVRVGPFCEFAPCPPLPASSGAFRVITPVNVGLSKYIDIPIANPPSDTRDVRYIIDRRSAYNQHRVTVRGTVVETLPDAHCPLINTYPRTNLACEKSRIVISALPTNNLWRDPKNDVVVLLPKGEQARYQPGKTVEIPVKVWGDRTGVALEKE